MLLKENSIIKDKISADGRIILYSENNDMWILVCLDKFENILKSKCFVFPRNFSKLEKQLKQQARKEFKSWLYELWETKTITPDDLKSLTNKKSML